MISNINKSKKRLISHNIAYENEMSGCSEEEILEIEARYGKLPLSYRQIIALIGHSAGLLTGNDTYFYISTNEEIDNIIYLNEIMIYDNDEEEEDNIPENAFLIDWYAGEFNFILTSSLEPQNDSPVYYWSSSGTTKRYQSVWQWIDYRTEDSFSDNRSNISPYYLSVYRKPYYKKSGEIVIQEGCKNIEIIKPFFAWGKNIRHQDWLKYMIKKQQRHK